MRWWCELDGVPAGFAQWYRWADYAEHASKLGAAETRPASTTCSPTRPDAARVWAPGWSAELIRQVRLAWPAVGGLVVDPEHGNGASCRVLEKNGFSLVRVVQLEDAGGHPHGPHYRRLPAHGSVRDLGSA